MTHNDTVEITVCNNNILLIFYLFSVGRFVDEIE